MAFLVSAENGTQNFLGQPAIQQAQLTFVIHVLEIVIEHGHIANAVIDSFSGNLYQHLCFGPGVCGPFPAPASTAEGEAEEILHLAQLVARKRYLAVSAEHQSEMAKLRCRSELKLWRDAFRSNRRGCRFSVGHIVKYEVHAMAGFDFQPQPCESRLETLPRQFS